MTDSLPAVRDEAPPAPDTDSWVQMMKPAIELAGHVASTDFVPRGLRDSAPAVAAAILYGREVGLAPMTALNMTHVVEGKPGISAEGMRALVLSAGHDLQVLETTGAVCIMRGRRRGSDNWTQIAWTLDMARAAGVAGKQVWQRYPRAMLQARATTELCRLVFPDVIHGFRSLEELEDMSEADAPSDGFPATPGTSKVARRGAAKKALPPAAAASSPRPSAGPGIPLPGEPGYQTSEGPGGPSDPDEPGGSSADSGEGGVVGATDTPSPGSTDSDAGDDSTPSPASDQTGAATPGTGEGGDEGEASNPSPTVPPRKSSAAQRRMIMARFGEIGVDTNDREERLLITSKIVGREVGSTNDLTNLEARALIDTLARIDSRDQLMRLLDTIDQAEAEKAAAERGEGDPS